MVTIICPNCGNKIKEFEGYGEAMNFIIKEYNPEPGESITLEVKCYVCGFIFKCKDKMP